MTDHGVTRRRAPTHPGELLREEVIPAMEESVSGFARAIRVSRQSVHKILAENKGITPEMALRIGKHVGNGAGFWLRMQQAYDLWQAEQRMGEELERITVHTTQSVRIQSRSLDEPIG